MHAVRTRVSNLVVDDTDDTVDNADNQPDPLLYYKMIILRYHEIFSG